MDEPGSRTEASGEWSVAAQTLSGIAITGDGARVDARTVALAAGGPRSGGGPGGGRP